MGVYNSKINIAYIDAANLDKAMKGLGWQLDYQRFRIWLLEKYKIDKAFIFIGLIEKYKNLYNYFQDCGFIIVFKDVLYQDGKTKGNCDSDLLMKATAVLVASDGDYAPLVKMLKEKDGIEVILSPAPAEKCSILLKRTNVPIAYIQDQKTILEKIS